MKKFLPFVLSLLTVSTCWGSITQQFSFSANDLTINAYTSNDTVYSRVESMTSPVPTMLVPGRAWWYYIDNNRYNPLMQSEEFNLEVGKEVTIDDVKWYEINKTLSCNVKTKYETYEEDSRTYDSIPLLMAYMREEGSKVYVLTNELCKWQEYGPYKSESADYYDPAINDLPWQAETGYGVCLAYDFGTIGSEWRMGSDELYGTLTIDSIETITNSGKEYDVYCASKNDNSTLPISLGWGGYKYAREIGPIGGEGCVYGELLFSPIGLYRANGPCWTSPELRWVTEGTDHEVIFEGLGGCKLWEDYAGVADITIDTDGLQPVVYYNLQGMQVCDPQPGTLVIEKRGNRVNKRLIR